MDRLDHDVDYKWHLAINAFTQGLKANEWPMWMYEAKRAADETARLARLFEMERKGELPNMHHQCSHDIQGQPVPDNHLTCCLGTECRNCSFLLALGKADGLTPEQIDQIKAWTCVTHILTEVGKSRGYDKGYIDTSEGFILTTDDRMYWDNVYASLASADSETDLSE